MTGEAAEPTRGERGGGDDDALRPLFVCGCPRSGTTLLGAMLGAHSDCVATPESHFVADVWTRHARDGAIDLQRAFDAITSHWRFRIWEHALPRPADLADWPQNGEGYRRLIRHVVATYAEGALAAHRTPRWWIDHTPGNVGAVAILSELFPEARFVHMVRDGRAVAASVLKLDWGPSTLPSAAHWWRERVGTGFAAQHFLGDRMRMVRYEDVVRAPRPTLERVCGFAGIDFQEVMLSGSGFRRPAYTAGQHGLIGQAPDASRAERWRSDLSKRDVEVFEAIAGDVLTYVGYERVCGPTPRPPSRRERFETLARRLVRDAANRLRHSLRQRRHARGRQRDATTSRR